MLEENKNINVEKLSSGFLVTKYGTTIVVDNGEVFSLMVDLLDEASSRFLCRAMIDVCKAKLNGGRLEND